METEQIRQMNKKVMEAYELLLSVTQDYQGVFMCEDNNKTFNKLNDIFEELGRLSRFTNEEKAQTELKAKLKASYEKVESLINHLNEFCNNDGNKLYQTLESMGLNVDNLDEDCNCTYFDIYIEDCMFTIVAYKDKVVTENHFEYFFKDDYNVYYATYLGKDNEVLLNGLR